MRTPRLIVLLAAFCLTLGLSGSALAAQKGVVTDLTWGISSAEQDHEAALIADSGAQWAAIDVNWTDIEPQQGTYDFSEIDSALAEIQKSGAKALVSVYGAPSWETGTNTSSDPPKNPQDFANFIGYLATRYKGQVAAWQVWNEPNHPFFWTNADTNPPYTGYDALLKASYPAIKAADPNALVVFGGLAYNDYSFLEGAYGADNTIGQYFDVIALHPYTQYAASPETVNYGSDGRVSQKSFTGFTELHNDLVKWGYDKPIWLTEFSWSTLSQQDTTTDLGGVDPATQADYLTRVYKLLQNYSYVQVALWYGLRNDPFCSPPDPPNQWVCQLGLLNSDFSPKPSYAAFKAVGAPPAPPPPAGAPAPPPPPTTPTATVTPTTTTTAPQPTAIVTDTAIKFHTRRLRHGHQLKLSLTGTVAGAQSGTVSLGVQRHVGRRWVFVFRKVVAVDRLGRFSLTAHVAFAKSLRAAALYNGATGYDPSLSPFAYVRA